MRKTFISLFAVLAAASFGAGASFGENVSLVYRGYPNEQSKNKIIEETQVEFKEPQGDQTVLNRKKQVETCLINDDFILDNEYSLISWRRVCPEEDTDYTCERKENLLVIKGKMNGESVDKEIELGTESLHIYPKYSLTKFVLSGMPKMKFWTLRRDQLSKLPMQAIKKGYRTIKVNGEKVEALEVYYSITGKLREKYFNHTYYYRKSDGLFLKKEEPDGRIEELVEEKR